MIEGQMSFFDFEPNKKINVKEIPNEQTKFTYTIREVDKEIALKMIKQFHYSNTLPKINKYYIGFFLEDRLVGLVTLGYGTRPLHTIKRIFPSLDTKDYLEIGRMCMTEDMPKNSESQMISQLIKWIKKNIPSLKILFTWADGMLGKPGYVYQASNFIYAGYSGGEMYMKDGVKIHVRQMKSVLLKDRSKDKRITVRPTLEQLREFNIEHYKGKQFRYLMFLCNKTEKKRLISECLIDLSLPNPKDEDLEWTKRNNETGKWEKTMKPTYVTDIDQKTKKIVAIQEQRICNECGAIVHSGYCIENGKEYYCSDECLSAWYSEEEYDELCQNDAAYWSEWE